VTSRNSYSQRQTEGAPTRRRDRRTLGVLGLPCLLEVAGRAPNLTILERTVNGQPGLVAQQDGVTVAVMAFEIAGDQITRIWAILNPGKLRPWATG